MSTYYSADEHPRRPNRIVIVPDNEPGPHAAGDRWWLPAIGPTATLLAELLAGEEASTEWSTTRLAGLLGVSTDRLWRALNRLETFGMLKFHSTDVATARRRWPELSEGALALHPDANGYQLARAAVTGSRR